MKVKSKLYLGFGLLITLLLAQTLIINYLLKGINSNFEDVINKHQMNSDSALLIRHNISNVSRAVRDVVLSPDKDYKESVQYLNDAMHDSEKAIANYKALDNKDTAALLINLELQYKTYETLINQVQAYVKMGNKNAAIKIIFGKGKETRLQLFDSVKALIDAEEAKKKEHLNISKQIDRRALNISIFMFVITLVVGGLQIYFLSRSLIKNIKEISNVIDSASQSEPENMLLCQSNSKDELGVIANAYNNLVKVLKKQAKENKELNTSLAEMNWFNFNLAEINTSFSGMNDINHFAAILLSKIAPVVGASYGVIYIKEGIGDKAYYEKKASYAYDGHELGRSKFYLGEGLVGQVAYENKPLEITNLPAGYTRVASGLGDCLPNTLMLLPICFESTVIGVLELAAMESFTDLQKKLLIEVCSQIGIVINRIHDFLKIEKLLEESQTMMEELQSQSEELQMQQEELKTINEELEEQYIKIEQKSRDLQVAKEELEKNAEELKRSNDFKSAFLANISHELRTPLNSLLILSQVLFENKERNLNPKQIEFAKTIYNSGNQLLELINDILDLSKIEAGKMEILTSALDITHTISSLEQQFKPLAKKKNIGLTTAIEIESAIEVNTDERRLQQILKNLISNAIKFTEQGSVKVKVKQTEEEVIFSVIDTGIGIPANKQALIFNAFEQADTTTSRKYGGTGLGLTISQELAKMLGGYIELESEIDQGSKFTLHLPLNPNTKSLDIQKQIAAAAIHSRKDNQGLDQVVIAESIFNGKKILLVDDDMRNVFALCAAFEKSGIEVVVAENGQEALDIVNSRQDLDLILMDIMMPVMDGYEAIQHIREKTNLKEIPIIALTAKAMKQDREKCLKIGASDYISKPVDIQQLFSVMHVWLC